MASFWSPAPAVIAGPCVLDSKDVNLVIAERLAQIGARTGLRIIFKGSFDKANRSLPEAPRGPGLDVGLAALTTVRAETGLPVLTDVHEPWQAEPVGAAADALQVPAFLCRQTDLLEAVGATGCPVNIKKGQWLAPEAMRGAVEKVRAAGASDVVLTERGTAFGYGDLVVDMRSFRRMRAATGVPVLFDATHAVQRPGEGPLGSSGGEREDVPALLRAAAAAGADGFFLETHPVPSQSVSDAATVWPLAQLEDLISEGVAVWHATRDHVVRS